jgi:hypothetical protein
LKIKIILAILILLTIGALIIIVNPSWKVLGNMRKDVPEVQTSSTDFSFQGAAGLRVKISLRTTVKEGIVDFILTDSEGNIVNEFDYADALETFIDLKNDDIYTMTAFYKDFTGKFSAEVSIKRF